MHSKTFIWTSVVVVVLGLLSLGAFAYKNAVPTPSLLETKLQPVVQEDSATTTPPTFAWRFTEDDSKNLDGMYQTNVFLDATYLGGRVESKLIDTTPGGCNELPDAAEDALEGIAAAQCYAAGLGYRYKVTEGESSYLVWRKTFEEALPDHTPPQYEYEVVAEYPLSR